MGTHVPERGDRVGTAVHERARRRARCRRPHTERRHRGGLGRSYGDAAQNAGGDVVRCTRLDRVLELDAATGICTVEAGVSIEMLMRVFLPLGWFPMVVPGTRHVTVGGAIASDIHGKFRHGSFADSVVSLRLMTPDRGLVTVSPTDEPDVFWATAGGMGLTGIITEATLQLQPVETAQMMVDTERAADVDDCMARMLERDRDYRYSVAWIDCLASGANLGRSVLTRGNHATLADLPSAKHAGARRSRRGHCSKRRRASPTGCSTRSRSARSTSCGSASRPTIAAVSSRASTAYFHPLDAVLDWNRIYGSRGLHAVPVRRARTARKRSCAPCSSD